MRARLMLKVVSMLVMLVLTVVGARSCSSGSSKDSPLDTTNLAKNGIAGLCANQEAEAQASGDSSPQTLDLSQTAGGQTPGGQSPGGNTSELNALSNALGGTQALGGSVSCPTTTVAQGG